MDIIKDSIRNIIKRIRKSKYINKFRIIALALLVGVILLATTFCQYNYQKPDESVAVETASTPTPSPTPPPTPPPTQTPTPTPSPTSTPEPTPEPEPPPDPYINPLTGERMEEATGRNRPIAVVHDNVGGALPQLGISRAGIIYEILVESGLTRMLALYHDVSDAGVLGSVRSARHNTVEIVYGYDAIMIHSGHSFIARDMMNNIGLDRANGSEGPNSHIFSRNPNRSSPHNHQTTGDRIMRFLPESGFRLEHEEDFRNALRFTEDGTPDNGNPAMSIELRFSSESKRTHFTYSQDDNVYRMRQNNRSYVDGNNSQAIGFTNVLILKTFVGADPRDGGGTLREITTTGRGEGYFINGGKYIEIVWSREDIMSQFVYTLKDGSALELGIGKTYIGLISDSLEPDISA